MKWWQMQPGPERERAKAADTRADRPISEHREPREVVLGEKRAFRNCLRDYFFRNDAERELQRRLALAKRQPLPGNLSYELRGTAIVAHGVCTGKEYEIGDLTTSPRIWGLYALAAGETEFVLSKESKSVQC